MKADITAEGVLVIIPESSLESYALSRYKDAWDNGQAIMCFDCEMIYPELIKPDLIITNPKSTGEVNEHA